MNDSLCFIHKHSTLDAIEGSLTYSNWYRFIYIGNLFQLSWAVFNTLLPITNKDHSKWHIISTGIRVPAVTSVSWNERLNVCVPRVAFKLTYWPRYQTKIANVMIILIGFNRIIFSCYSSFNINVFAIIWISINLAILFPSKPVKVVSAYLEFNNWRSN